MPTWRVHVHATPLNVHGMEKRLGSSHVLESCFGSDSIKVKQLSTCAHGQEYPGLIGARLENNPSGVVTQLLVPDLDLSLQL